MKTEGVQNVPGRGVKVSTSTYPKLKAFQGGGDYWDHQDLIRESLGAFLPPVQQARGENGEPFGLFTKTIGNKEVLGKSKPVGSGRIPEGQIAELTAALETLKKKAEAPETQMNAKGMIQQFRLPDIAKDPDLYRLYGPWWNRKLQVLWGCERTADTSLPPASAVAKLPIDKAYGFKRALAILCLLCLLCAFLWLLFRGIPMARDLYARLTNQRPIAALKLDKLTEADRTAIVSDAGSRDPDGSITEWKINWGDGKEEQFTNRPNLLSHAFDTEQDHTITLTCVDNLGLTSSPPASVVASFVNQKLADAQKEADEIKKKAQDEANKTKQEADAAQAKAKDAADAAAAKAKEAEAEAAKNRADADQAKADADKAKADADKAKADADKANDDAKNAQKALDDANTKLKDAADKLNSLPTQSPVANNNAPESPNDPNPQKSDPEQGLKNAPKLETPKGSQALVAHKFEIVKAGVGSAVNGKVEVILAVRDKQSPNSPIDVQMWDADGYTYKSQNANFTVQLPAGEHEVKVLVRRSASDPVWQKAKVTVTSETRQTTDGDFKVESY